VDDDCYDWSNGDYVCFLLLDEAEEEVEEETEEGGYVETVTVSGHSDNTYNGIYVRGNDWNSAPHFAMGTDRHLYYQPGTYWQLDYRDQEAIGFSDFFAGGYEYDSTFVGGIYEINDDCYSWSNGDNVCFVLG